MRERLYLQVQEYRKKLEDGRVLIEGSEEAKKKALRDLESLQMQYDALKADNDKLGKSKRKLETELEDMTVELETYRSNLSTLEKKQRKFDQNLAEEKAVSERSVSGNKRVKLCQTLGFVAVSNILDLHFWQIDITDISLFFTI